MRADRLLSILMLLQGRGQMTAKTLAAEVGVSRRTILRDVEALSMAGIPLYTDGGHGGGIALDENYRTTLTGLQEAEVQSMFIASNTEFLHDIGLGEAAERTLLKLFAALPARYQPSVDHIRQRIYIDPLWWWHDSQPLPFWADLQQAVYEDHRISATYEHYNGEIVERVLEPYSLVAKSGMWYLIARRDGALRTYRVSRFHTVTLLDQRFQRDPTFDLITYWQEHLRSFMEELSDYAFTLRIHPDRLNFARWLVPGRCDVLSTSPEDGWVTAHFHLDSLDLAKMLVFGLGKQGEVIEPPELQEAVQTAAREVIEQA